MIFEKLSNPFENLSIDEKKIALDEIGKVNLLDYHNSLLELRKILSEYNPIVILSHLSDYALTIGAGDEGVETTFKRQIEQPHIEICQALILQIEYEKLKHKTPSFETFQKIIDLLEKLLLSNQLKNSSSNTLDLEKKDFTINAIREEVIAHTQYVRNWGNFSQLNTITDELYHKFDRELLETYHFQSSHIIGFFNYLVKEIEKDATKKLNLFREVRQQVTTKEMVYKYCSFIDENRQDAEKLIQFLSQNKIVDKEDVFGVLYHNYVDTILASSFIFNINNIAKALNCKVNIIVSLVTEFSYMFGALADYNSEHLFLGNPVWTKPIIVLSEEEFFCSNPVSFFSFISRVFDDLIEKIDAQKLSEVKAQYLESKIEQIVKSKFPNEIILKSFKWNKYENDLLLFVDTYIVIFEAKSGKITDSALRGSSSRLKKKIKELLIAPNIQSKRLKDKLEFLIANPHKKDSLRKKLPIVLSENHRVLRVSVTLEYFATLASNIVSLKNTEWIPSDYSPCPTMNIASFETLFDIFDNQIQLINYLEIREELEGKVNYRGDELDLIASYMQTHLNFGDVNNNASLYLVGMSNEIDKYYQSKEIGIDINKPKPIINDFFQKILIELAIRKPHGWLLMGSCIYRLSPDDQSKISQTIIKLKENVKKNWAKQGHDNTIIYTPLKSYKYVFSLVVFCDKNKNDRYTLFDNSIGVALEVEHVEYCLGIGINLDRSDVPYILIAVSNKSDNMEGMK